MQHIPLGTSVNETQHSHLPTDIIYRFIFTHAKDQIESQMKASIWTKQQRKKKHAHLHPLILSKYYKNDFIHTSRRIAVYIFISIRPYIICDAENYTNQQKEHDSSAHLGTQSRATATTKSEKKNENEKKRLLESYNVVFGYFLTQCSSRYQFTVIYDSELNNGKKKRSSYLLSF